jgi:DNA repair protein RecN (Recombination protein N)
MTDRALKELHTAQEYDDSFAELVKSLQTAEELLTDVNHGLMRYIDSMEFSEAEYIETETRLNLLNHLKNKYGATLEEVLSYHQKQQDMLKKLMDMTAYREDLVAKMQRERALLWKLSQKASDIRRKYALILQKQMKQALLDLNFLEVQFEISVRSSEEKLSASGYDEVEFMIALNPGEALKSLGAVASGGELSRIMLALKTVLARQDHVETLIFDEIDAGISGKTAWKVSEKLAVLGKEHQVICITHLPQIAAMADTHFMIQKSVQNQVTTTELVSLSRNEMIEEIARLLGSDMMTEAVMNNAIELKKMADETKHY